MRIKALILLFAAAAGLAVPPAGAEGPFTNKDVVKLVAAGIGEGLVIAKIKEAPKVDFALEVDDLVALRKAGVSEKIVEAMLDRKTSAASPWSSPAQAPPLGGMPGIPAENPWASMQEDLGYELLKVALQSSEGTVRIPLLRGDVSSPGFMGFSLTYMNYPGVRASARTRDRRPSLLVKSSAPLTGGRYFLTKLDVDQDDGVRSLKISSMKGGLKAVFTGNTRAAVAPDPDWTLPYESVEESPGIWRVTAKSDLEPGEYGWYVDLGANSGQAAGIFSFGVD